MESISALNSSMGFDNPNDSEIETLIPIQHQDCDLVQSIDSSVLLLSLAPDDSAVAEEDAKIAVDELQAVVSSQARDMQVPVFGMEFDSPEAARSFYSSYAEQVGFRVRNSKSFTSRVDETVIMRRFVCSKQGRPTKKDPFDLSKKRRNRVSSREGCKAMLQVNRRENGCWAISRCVLEHCHALGLVSKPSASVPKKLGKKPWEVVACPPVEVHPNGLGPGGGVAQSLLEYFKKMQADNPAFFYAVQLDRNNCVSNVFWADARARMAYGYFGDTVTFDTTCKKNKRVVPFATFTGINHHRQLVVFGCAFMTDESEESFTWLFETWLTLMSGHRPVSFVTEFNEAVAGAVLKVFPDVCHRVCKRDILSKCKDKLSGVYSTHSSFKNEFKRCVNESETIKEFDSSWGSLISTYDLGDNLWLRMLYDVRHRWVPLFFITIFFGEISGTSKMETMHKFFQRHSITTTTLRDLVSQFDKAMAGQYEKEVQSDFEMLNNRPVLRTPTSMEKQASEFYTSEIFEVFQEELTESSGFLMETVEDGTHSKYRVAKVEDTRKTYIVTYNASERVISCTCCKFEFSGILCRHVFRVLIVAGVVNIPENYFLRRWTRDAKSNILSYENSGVTESNHHKMLTWRCNDLCQDAIRFAEEGGSSGVIYKVAKGALQKALNEVLAAKRGPFCSEAR